MTVVARSSHDRATTVMGCMNFHSTSTRTYDCDPYRECEELVDHELPAGPGNVERLAQGLHLRQQSTFFALLSRKAEELYFRKPDARETSAILNKPNDLFVLSLSSATVAPDGSLTKAAKATMRALG